MYLEKLSSHRSPRWFIFSHPYAVTTRYLVPDQLLVWTWSAAFRNYQAPWSKLYPVAKIWHGSGNTYIVYSSVVGCYFWNPSEAFTSSVFWAKLFRAWILWKLQMLCTVIRPMVKLISSPLLKLPSRTFSFRTLYMGSSKDPAIDFCSEVLSPLSYYATFLTDFQKPQTVGCLRFQQDFMLLIWFPQATSFLCPCQHCKEKSRLRRFAKKQKQFHSHGRKKSDLSMHKISLK